MTVLFCVEKFDCHKHSLQILGLKFEFFERNGTVMEHIWMKDCEIDRSIESEISAEALLLRSVVSFSQCLCVLETFVESWCPKKFQCNDVADSFPGQKQLCAFFLSDLCQ